MSSSPLISVLIPVFNAEASLRRCINSVLFDAEKNGCEILIIDDGSTDGSSKILDDFAKNHPSIRLLRQANRGYVYSSNQMLEMAQGKFLLPLDSDNYLLDGSLDWLCGFLKEHPDVDLIEFDMVPFISGHEPLVSKKGDGSVNLYFGEYALRSALVDNTFSLNTHSGKIFKQELAKGIVLQGNPRGADTRFVRHLFMRVSAAARIEGSITLFFECRPNSLSHRAVEGCFWSSWLDVSCAQLPQQKSEADRLGIPMPLIEMIDLPTILFNSFNEKGFSWATYHKHGHVLWRYRRMVAGKPFGMSFFHLFFLAKSPPFIIRMYLNWKKRFRHWLDKTKMLSL